MTVLSAQSIRGLCTLREIQDETETWYSTRFRDEPYTFWTNKPLISPFLERGTQNGRSFGLSACSYDCRIADSLIVPVGQSRLAATLERFAFPDCICGSVLDKSTYARVFLSAFNTHLDPGWEGYLTVELTNLGREAVVFQPGDPLVQIKFEWLDFATDRPYAGKYQNQEAGPQGARREQ